MIDIINIAIETLVRHRYELPAFDTLLRETRAERIATNQALHTQLHDRNVSMNLKHLDGNMRV